MNGNEGPFRSDQLQELLEEKGNSGSRIYHLSEETPTNYLTLRPKTGQNNPTIVSKLIDTTLDSALSAMFPEIEIDESALKDSGQECESAQIKDKVSKPKTTKVDLKSQLFLLSQVRQIESSDLLVPAKSDIAQRLGMIKSLGSVVLEIIGKIDKEKLLYPLLNELSEERKEFEILNNSAATNEHFKLFYETDTKILMQIQKLIEFFINNDGQVQRLAEYYVNNDKEDASNKNMLMSISSVLSEFNEILGLKNYDSSKELINTRIFVTELLNKLEKFFNYLFQEVPTTEKAANSLFRLLNNIENLLKHEQDLSDSFIIFLEKYKETISSKMNFYEQEFNTKNLLESSDFYEYEENLKRNAEWVELLLTCDLFEWEQMHAKELQVINEIAISSLENLSSS